MFEYFIHSYWPSMSVSLFRVVRWRGRVNIEGNSSGIVMKVDHVFAVFLNIRDMSVFIALCRYLQFIMVGPYQILTLRSSNWAVVVVMCGIFTYIALYESWVLHTAAELQYPISLRFLHLSLFASRKKLLVQIFPYYCRVFLKYES